MKIKDAVIIHGPGKSGTTLLNDILALHPDLFWISTYVNRHPQFTGLSFLNNIQSIELLERYSRNIKKIARPAEPFQFFSYYIRDFRFNLSTFDSNEIMKLQQALTTVGEFQKGERFITKITGPSRTDFLEQIFEDPFVIWIDREPKAIIASYFKYKWRYKTRQDEFAAKSKKDLIKEYTEYYNWIKTEKDRLKKFRFKRVTYEDLVENPNEFFENLCMFLNLDYTSGFQKTIDSWDIRNNTNEQYKNLFNEQEIDYLNSLLHEQKKKI